MYNNVINMLSINLIEFYNSTFSNTVKVFVFKYEIKIKYTTLNTQRYCIFFKQNIIFLSPFYTTKFKPIVKNVIWSP